MFTVEKVDGEYIEEIEKSRTYGYVKVCANDESSRYCILTRKMADNYLQRIKEMEIYEDDVWIVTFAKCGTTWTQEMLWMLNNNLDYKTAYEVKLDDRFPFIEDGGVIIESKTDSFIECDKLTRPRHIKTHLPSFLLPDKIWTVKPKIVYVARNPKDAAVSFYHHYRNLNLYKGTKEVFLNAFLNNQMLFCPFKDHVIEFWKLREDPNILFLFYEDMKRNLDNEVKRAMNFLGKDYSQDQIDKLCEHLSFDSMKKNPSCNNEDLIEYLKTHPISDENIKKNNYSFIRKGQVGSHTEEFSEEMTKKFDEFVNDPQFRTFNFAYKF